MTNQAIVKILSTMERFNIQHCKSELKKNYFMGALVMWAEVGFDYAFETYLLNDIANLGLMMAMHAKVENGEKVTKGITVCSPSDEIQALPVELKSLYIKSHECRPDDTAKESRAVYDWLLEE